MSTRSCIGFWEVPEARLRIMYCHNCGDISHNGVLLQRCYDADKLSALFDMYSNVSVLAADVPDCHIVRSDGTIEDIEPVRDMYRAEEYIVAYGMQSNCEYGYLYTHNPDDVYPDPGWSVIELSFKNLVDEVDKLGYVETPLSYEETMKAFEAASGTSKSSKIWLQVGIDSDKNIIGHAVSSERRVSGVSTNWEPIKQVASQAEIEAELGNPLEEYCGMSNRDIWEDLCQRVEEDGIVVLEGIE